MQFNKKMLNKNTFVTRSGINLKNNHFRASAYLNLRPGNVGESGIVLLDDDFLGRFVRKGNFLNMLGVSEPMSEC